MTQHWSVASQGESCLTKAEIDLEKMAFELLAQRAPHLADLLVWMAALPVPLPELIEHFRALTTGMNKRDFDATVNALRYARRSVSAAEHDH